MSAKQLLLLQYQPAERQTAQSEQTIVTKVEKLCLWSRFTVESISGL